MSNVITKELVTNKEDIEILLGLISVLNKTPANIMPKTIGIKDQLTSVCSCASKNSSCIYFDKNLLISTRKNEPKAAKISTQTTPTKPNSILVNRVNTVYLESQIPATIASGI